MPPGRTAHCDHAGNDPDQDVCTLNPDPQVDQTRPVHVQYCQEFIYVCGDSYGWSSVAECEADAGFILPGSPGDVGGDTLGCRQCKDLDVCLGRSNYPPLTFHSGVAPGSPFIICNVPVTQASSLSQPLLAGQTTKRSWQNSAAVGLPVHTPPPDGLAWLQCAAAPSGAPRRAGPRW